MEKTIVIDGKDIKLKSNAMLPLIYRSAFGEDIFKKQATLFAVYGSEDVEVEKDGKKIKETVMTTDLTKLDSIGFMRVMWCMAKCADSAVPVFEEWLEGFEVFPILDVLAEVQDIYMANMKSTTPIKNKKATENA